MKAASLGLLLVLGVLPVLASLSGLVVEPAAAWDALLQERVWRLLGQTLALGSCVALASALIGVPVAARLASATGPWGRRLAWLLPLPLILPPWICGVAWLEALPLTGFFGAVFLLTASLWPLCALFALRGFRVAARGAQAARLLRGPREAFWRIELPLAGPSILAGTLLVFAFAVTDFSVVDLLSFTTPENFVVLPSEVFQRWDKERSTAGAASMTLLAALPTLLALAAAFKLEARHAGSLRGQAPVTIPARRWSATSVVATLGLIVSLAVPVGVLLGWAVQVEGPAAVLGAARASILTSVGVALASASGVALLGVALARLSLRTSARRAHWLLMLIVLPLAVPGVSFGVGLIRVWGRWLPDLVAPLGDSAVAGVDAFAESPGLLVLAFVGRHVPLAVLAARALLLRQDPAPFQAATLVERSPLQRWWRIDRPLLAPALGLAFALGYLLAMRELDLVVLPRAGADTYSHYIFSMVHNGSDRVTALLCLTLVCLVLLPAGLAQAFGVKGVDCEPADGEP